MLSIINENLVVIYEHAINKNKILKDMVELLYKEKRINDKKTFYQDILKREKMQSTGIGENIAIPHSKNKTVRLISVVIAICKKEVNFKSLDKKPVKIIFMVAAPDDFNAIYLQTVAKIARLLKNKKWRDKFINAQSEKHIIELIREFDRVYPDRLKINVGQSNRVLYKNRS